LIDVRNYSAIDALRDGTPVTVRAIGKEDSENIRSTFDTLDRDSVYTRFFTYKKSLSDAEVRQLTEIDPSHVAALVVTQGGKIIAGGRYIADDQHKSAELAFLTGANNRGRGLASLVLQHLKRIGREQGIEVFEAEVLTQNAAMLAVFRQSGLLMRTRIEGSVTHVKLSLKR
jgi:RimJ/RimL family protein N-acetyltransferase